MITRQQTVIGAEVNALRYASVRFGAGECYNARQQLGDARSDCGAAAAV